MSALARLFQAMTVLLLLLIILALALWLKRPGIEITLGSIFAAPVVLFALGHGIGTHTGTALLSLLLTLAIAFFLTKPAKGLVPTSGELLVGGSLLVSYLVFYRLSLLWPDFVSIGERLRDYALLAAAYRNPLTPPEPWMSDTVLNYYVYWYRFGQFLGALFGESVWSIYHQMAALALASYFACCVRLLATHLRFSPASALVGSLIIACGSNLSGITHFLTRDANWWGPSRVVPGAINEFPAWSFLLGDLHPHYLNLCVLPLMSSVVLFSVRSTWASFGSVLSLLIWAVLTPFWLYAANAWEIPIWGIYSLWIAFGLALVIFQHLSKIEDRPALLKSFCRELSPKTIGIVSSLVVVGLALTLYWSTLHLRQPDNFELRWVTKPLPRTMVLDLLQHWGIQLSLIALCVVVAERNMITGIVGILILALGVVFSDEALLPLLFLFLITLIQRTSFLLENWKKDSSQPGVLVFSATLPLVFLSVVIFPELAFVDDAYGDDIERMNTIFKFYSAGWWMSWISVFVLAREAIQRIPQQLSDTLASIAPRWILIACAVVIMTGFFIRTIPLRKTERFSVTPMAQGLSTVDQKFPGSAGAIKALSEARGAVVLEAQGNAYDFTGFVATLSGQQSFLGWGNHVGLLTNKYDEVRRRETLTESWYREEDCEKRRSILISERISHVVIGSLENQRYGVQPPSATACLREFTRSGDYVIVMP